jgi:hypothetical protein
MFGSDSTGGGIGFQFRQIKHWAQRQKACANSGGVLSNIDNDLAIASYGTVGTKYALQHRMREVLAEAKRLRAGGDPSLFSETNNL